MSKRYALIYTDGSMNVHGDAVDQEKARKMLGLNSDDPDTELVEIEFTVLKRFGPKEVPKHEPVSERATWIQGVMFAAAIIRSNGEEVTAQDLVNHIGLDELKKGICAEQDEKTYQWLKEINDGTKSSE